MFWGQHRETPNAHTKLLDYAQVLQKAAAATDSAWRLKCVRLARAANLPYSLTLKCPIWHLFYGRFTHALSDAETFYQRGKKETDFEKFLGCSKYSTLGRVFVSDSSRSFSKTERIKENWWRELTLNFLMFHEVTKPYEQEKNARVKVVFQHPKHDWEAKWTTYLTQAAQK